MAFTKIFLESGVRIPPDEPKEVFKHADFYTIETLTRMGFEKDSRWIRKITPTPLSVGTPPLAPRASASPS